MHEGTGEDLERIIMLAGAHLPFGDSLRIEKFGNDPRSHWPRWRASWGAASGVDISIQGALEELEKEIQALAKERL